MVRAILLVIVIGSMTALYLLSKNKYEEVLGPLDKKEYPLKDFFPLALYLLDTLGYTYNSWYERRIFLHLTELYDQKNARYYLKIHWVNKTAYLLLGCLLASVLGAAMEEIDFIAVMFFLAVTAGLFLAPDYELKERINKRRTQIRLEFPNFINKLILLINAGMTIPRAWEKAVLDKPRDTCLYLELNRVLLEIRGGKPEPQAYEDFAKRCRTPEITKFISVILQNMKKGTGDLSAILRLQSVELWEMRKHTAKRMGEEASTKLLFPMMLMFLAILIIAASPAIFAMRGM